MRHARMSTDDKQCRRGVREREEGEKDRENVLRKKIENDSLKTQT